MMDEIKIIFFMIFTIFMMCIIFQVSYQIYVLECTPGWIDCDDGSKR